MKNLNYLSNSKNKCIEVIKKIVIRSKKMFIKYLNIALNLK